MDFLFKPTIRRIIQVQYEKNGHIQPMKYTSVQLKWALLTTGILLALTGLLYTYLGIAWCILLLGWAINNMYSGE